MDASEMRRINRERVARLRTGKYIDPEDVRDSKITGSFHAQHGMASGGRRYVPPRDRMLEQLYARRTDLRETAEAGDPAAEAELLDVNRQINRLLAGRSAS